MLAIQPRWIRAFVLIGAGLFVFALALSAVFDPTIRVLHALQALIYIAVIVLARRGSAWGFGAGFVISAVWNYINLFVTGFVGAGFEALAHSVRTMHLERPELLVAVAASIGHFMLLIACLVGFLLNRPRAKNWAQFAAGGVVAVGYFIAIIWTTGPQYIPLVKRALHL
jgi:hypothetical protein